MTKSGFVCLVQHIVLSYVFILMLFFYLLSNSEISPVIVNCIPYSLKVSY